MYIPVPRLQRVRCLQENTREDEGRWMLCAREEKYVYASDEDKREERKGKTENRRREKEKKKIDDEHRQRRIFYTRVYRCIVVMLHLLLKHVSLSMARQRRKNV
ncbi:hypothetical protein ACS0PU_000939 [Formica fusca]